MNRSPVVKTNVCSLCQHHCGNEIEIYHNINYNSINETHTYLPLKIGAL